MSTGGPLLFAPSLVDTMHYPPHHSTTGAPSTSSSMSTAAMSSPWMSSGMTGVPSYMAPQPTRRSYMSPPHSAALSLNQSPPLQVHTSFPEQAPQSLVATTSYDSMASIPARPHSSPSNLGPNQETMMWGSNPLRISSSGYDEQVFQPTAFASDSHLEADRQPHEIRTPQPQRLYQSIAPNPVGLMSLGSNKRAREDEDGSPEMSNKRRQRSASLAMSSDLGEEDRLLFQLKDEENLPWKDIAARFKTDLGKTYQVPALQMRFKRLRERLRVWTDVDVNALRMAYEYWQKNKFEIIASKMVEFGSAEKWSARQCAKKWQEFAPTSDLFIHNSVPTPFSQASSPIEGPGYISYLHL